MGKLKQIFCKHDYKPVANIYGDLSLNYNNSRTVVRCCKCHKLKYIQEYIEAPLDFNKILYRAWLMYNSPESISEIKALEDQLVTQWENFYAKQT